MDDMIHVTMHIQLLLGVLPSLWRSSIYIPLLRSMIALTSRTSPRSLAPPMKSQASNDSSVPLRISRARLDEPPSGSDDGDEASIRG